MILKDCHGREIPPNKVLFYSIPKILISNPYKFFDSLDKIRFTDEDKFIFYIDFPYWYVAVSPQNLKDIFFGNILEQLPPLVSKTIRANEDYITPILHQCKTENFNFILDCYGYVREGAYFPIYKESITGIQSPAVIQGWKTIGKLPVICEDAQSVFSIFTVDQEKDNILKQN